MNATMCLLSAKSGRRPRPQGCQPAEIAYAPRRRVIDPLQVKPARVRRSAAHRSLRFIRLAARERHLPHQWRKSGRQRYSAGCARQGRRFQNSNVRC